ncbi:proton channel OtopLc-like [Diorhabda carinulata]|uniref:proton channel OtopLc-like n=1 Tax=Diorhabda carinulata TaxID=1163345 RepID=UPI0025A24DB8|nr:proton channel OtopLc-like [Diorhabda carinulata]
MENRLHHSLPTLDIEYPREKNQKHQHQKKKKGRQLEDEILTYVLSAFYAKILVLIGIAFSITRSITEKGSVQHDIYYIYLYTGSIMFLLYMYLIHSRTKSVLQGIYNGINRQSNELMDIFKKQSYIRYGSFYYRMGIIGFGVGSLIYATLRFGEYFEYDSNENCASILRAVKPATRVAFILLQMLFIFSFSNFLAVQKSQIIAKFGLMHLIATNVSDWFQVLTEETVHDLWESILTKHKLDNNNSTTSLVEEKNSRILQIVQIKNDQYNHCLKIRIISPILQRIEPHLASCAVEYNLLCTMILLLMWKNSTSQNKEASRDLSTEISRQSGSNVIYGRSQNQFSVDCAQTQRGLFSGILVLAATIISLILFFELIPHTSDVALLQMSTWEAIIFVTSTVVTIMCTIRLRDMKISQFRTELQLEHLLLLVTQFGVFIYFIFQIMSGFLMGYTRTEGKMRIIAPFMGVIQSFCQTAFILDAWRRQCATECQIRRKPGKQLITFLLLINVSLWVINRVKNNRSAFHPNQMNFYGILTWNIITHVSMPLVVSYRFQATVCFYEIWKQVYKQPIKHTSTDLYELEEMI